MQAFFHMGGYALYVWCAYGAALAVMGGLVVLSLAEFRRHRRLVDELEHMDGARPRRAAMPMSGETRS